MPQREVIQYTDAQLARELARVNSTSPTLLDPNLDDEDYEAGLDYIDDVRNEHARRAQLRAARNVA